MKPLVLMIIPVYQVHKIISGAFCSAAAITSLPIEIVAITDDYQDRAGNLVRRYTCSDSRIVMPNSGRCTVYNTGIAHANEAMGCF